jgi:hypothetical protein
MFLKNNNLISLWHELNYFLENVENFKNFLKSKQKLLGALLSMGY